MPIPDALRAMELSNQRLQHQASRDIRHAHIAQLQGDFIHSIVVIGSIDPLSDAGLYRVHNTYLSASYDSPQHVQRGHRFWPTLCRRVYGRDARLVAPITQLLVIISQCFSAININIISIIIISISIYITFEQQQHRPYKGPRQIICRRRAATCMARAPDQTLYQ